MNKLPAFELASGERIMLTGGFGGISGWVWSLPFLSIVVMIGLVFIYKGQVTREGLEFMLVFGAIGIWPFARSGKYSLTNQRLIWRPRLGRSLAIDLTSILEDCLKVKPFTSSLRVRFGNRKVTLRYIRGLERLWGGILLFRGSSPIRQIQPGLHPLTDCLIWKAWRVEGTFFQKGYIVFRPDFTAFLPTELMSNVLADTLIELGLAFMKIHQAKLNVKFPFDLWLEALREKTPAEFDRAVLKAADSFGGMLLRPGEAKLIKRNIPLRPGHKALWFDMNGTSIRVPALPEQILSKYEVDLGW